MCRSNPLLYSQKIYVCGSGRTIAVGCLPWEPGFYKVYDMDADIERQAKYEPGEAEEWEITADAFDSVGEERPEWVDKEAKRHEEKNKEAEAVRGEGLRQVAVEQP